MFRDRESLAVLDTRCLVLLSVGFHISRFHQISLPCHRRHRSAVCCDEQMVSIIRIRATQRRSKRRTEGQLTPLPTEGTDSRFGKPQENPHDSTTSQKRSNETKPTRDGSLAKLPSLSPQMRREGNWEECRPESPAWRLGKRELSPPA